MALHRVRVTGWLLVHMDRMTKDVKDALHPHTLERFEGSCGVKEPSPVEVGDLSEDTVGADTLRDLLDRMLRKEKGITNKEATMSGDAGDHPGKQSPQEI